MSVLSHRCRGVLVALRGFTLIELLVVVAIIALLIAILFPSLTTAREQAKRVMCASNIHQVSVGVGVYAGANKARLPHFRLCTGVGNRPSQYLNGDDPALRDRPHYQILHQQDEVRYFHYDKRDGVRRGPDVDPYYYVNLGRLWPQKIITDGAVFYCPSQKDRKYQLKWYSPFPSRHAIGPDGEQSGHRFIRVPLDFNPHVKLPGDRRFPGHRDYERLHQSTDKTPLTRVLIVDLMSSGTSGYSHMLKGRGGFNIASINGSCLFRRTEKGKDYATALKKYTPEKDSDMPFLWTPYIAMLEDLERGFGGGNKGFVK